MKLDSRQKYERIRQFITQMKEKSAIEPFLNIDEITRYGVFDFCYINQDPPTFESIEKKLKEHKYQLVSQVFEDIKQIFQSVSDYALTDDPIQIVCEQFISQIDKYFAMLSEEFKTMANVTRSKHKIHTVRREKQTKQQVESKQYMQLTSESNLRNPSLESKLEMVLWLKANQANEAYLRQIADQYDMGAQDENYFYISLDNKNSKWMEFIEKISAGQQPSI